MTKDNYISSTEVLKFKFISKANNKYNSKFDYTKVRYVNNKTHVVITCPIHGDFKQTPNQHLKQASCGCCQCGIELRAKSKTLSTEKYCIKATEKHNGFYGYAKVMYKHNKNIIDIECPIHGMFKQAAYIHLHGQGCPKCGRAKTTQAKQSNPDKNGWSYSNWKTAGETSKDFDSFKLYIIECSNDYEYFTKIGKTFTSVEKRFYGNRLPYKWKIIRTIEGSAKYISKLEEELHRNLTKAGMKYIPKQTFNGANECYKGFLCKR